MDTTAKSPLLGMVKHFLKCNLDQIVKRSILHCHTPNVHSIVLSDAPQMIRLFVATPYHQLHLNHPTVIRESQTVGFHPHHCDLTLVPTRGQVWNWTIKPSDSGDLLLKEYQYQSAITQGKIGFSHVGECRFKSAKFKYVGIGAAEYMDATDIHTIYCPEGKWAAWFALEGKENPNYDNKCWSSADIENQDFSGLYKPMSRAVLFDLLTEANLLE